MREQEANLVNIYTHYVNITNGQIKVIQQNENMRQPHQMINLPSCIKSVSLNPFTTVNNETHHRGN